MNFDDEIMGVASSGVPVDLTNQPILPSLSPKSDEEFVKNSSSHFSSPTPYSRINLKSFERPKRLIEYDKDGVPHPYTEMRIPKSQVDNVLLAALNLPYDGTYDPVTGEPMLESEFEGLNYLEVGMIKMARRAASGDMDSFKYLVDRVAGKAKQAIETTNVNLSLQDVLAQMDAQGTSTPTYPTASIDISSLNLHELLDEEL